MKPFISKRAKLFARAEELSVSAFVEKAIVYYIKNMPQKEEFAELLKSFDKDLEKDYPKSSAIIS